jgi:hypothetical protein
MVSAIGSKTSRYNACMARHFIVRPVDTQLYLDHETYLVGLRVGMPNELAFDVP